ncbi:MAG: acyl-CoA dehydrogenase family protein [Pseudonocardia sediminis]
MSITAEDRLHDYRHTLRGWLAEHVPANPSGDVEEAKAFQAALYDAGYSGITWPKESGGQGLGQAEQQIFAEEAAAFEMPVRPFLISMGMCGPTIVDLGTDEQKSRYLPPLLRGEEIWCQLFSEPGAGSDVASLQCKAVPDGDGWVLTGQKVWTSNAQWADYGAILARTDPDRPKHGGITMFVVDMRAPGVTVRPLVDMTGGAPFNEVYLDAVRVGPGDVLGEVNGGWSAAVTMLGHERVTISGLRQKRSNGLTYDSLADLSRRHGADPVARDRLADLYAHQRVLELFNARMRQETVAGAAPGSRGSVGKLAGAMLLRRAVDTAGHLAGANMVAWEDGDAGAASVELGTNSTPASNIAGGTNEIQRGIIGDRILGLPREPQVDRGVAFRELKVGTQASAEQAQKGVS